MKRLKLVIGIVIILIFLVSLYIFYIHKRQRAVEIIFTTDLRGYLDPHLGPVEVLKLSGFGKLLKKDNPPLLGGVAYFARYVKKLKPEINKNRSILLLDGGNIFLGTPKGYFSKGKVSIDVMNVLGYDAMAIGSKDFYFGVENLKELARRANFPFLACNIVYKDSKKIPEFIQPYIIKKYQGIKVGIIGITLPDIKKYTSPEKIIGLEFLSPIDALKRYLPEMRAKGTDLIVVLSRLGIEEDRKLTKKVPGLDVILGFKEYWDIRLADLLRKDISRKYILSHLWQYWITIQHLRVFVNSQTKAIKKYEDRWWLVWVTKNDIGKQRISPKGGILGYSTPDPEIRSILDNYSDLVEKQMKQTIGYCSKTLPRSRDSESALGDWVADAMLEASGADIAFCGGIEADLNKGNITLADIYRILPFGNSLLYNISLVMLKLTGEEIKDILERSISWALESSKYGILQVSGLKMIYDPTRPRWHRVTEVTVNGEKLSLDKTYKVVVNGFLATGGDRYYDIVFAKDKIDTGILIFDLLADEVRKYSPVVKEVDGRIIQLVTPKEVPNG